MLINKWTVAYIMKYSMLLLQKLVNGYYHVTISPPTSHKFPNIHCNIVSSPNSPPSKWLKFKMFSYQNSKLISCLKNLNYRLVKYHPNLTILTRWCEYIRKLFVTCYLPSYIISLGCQYFFQALCLQICKLTFFFHSVSEIWLCLPVAWAVHRLQSKCFLLHIKREHVILQRENTFTITGHHSLGYLQWYETGMSNLWNKDSTVDACKTYYDHKTC